MAWDFTTVLRGYERAEVEQVLGRATAALETGGAAQRAAARDELRAAQFAVALRGYDRLQVDRMVAGLLTLLDQAVTDGDLRADLAAVLRLDGPTDRQVVDEVRRLRELADRHDL